LSATNWYRLVNALGRDVTNSSRAPLAEIGKPGPPRSTNTVCLASAEPATKYRQVPTVAQPRARTPWQDGASGTIGAAVSVDAALDEQAAQAMSRQAISATDASGVR
jgi:hypothetical protein